MSIFSRLRMRPALRDERGSIVVPAHPHVFTPSMRIVWQSLKYDIPEIHGRLRTVVNTLFRYWSLVGLCAVFLGLFAYAYSYFRPTRPLYEYAQSNLCITNPILLPAVHTQIISSAFDIKLIPAVTVFGYPLYSHISCLTQTQPYSGNRQVVSMRALGLPFLQKDIVISAPARPEVSYQSAQSKISTLDPLQLNLSVPDATHTYMISTQDATVFCAGKSTTLICNMADLKLKQSSRYELSVTRHFYGKQVDTPLTFGIETIDAVVVTASSIATESVVYDTPRTITLSMNKPIVEVWGVALIFRKDGQDTAIDHSVEISGSQLTITATADWPRDAGFFLTIENVIAADRSSFERPYLFSFTTSGGPKVLSTNAKSYGFLPYENIWLQFDVGLEGKQDLSRHISLEVDNTSLGYSFSLDGGRVTIRPYTALPNCTGFTVRVNDGLASQYGVSGISGWSFRGRTQCASVWSLGASVQGRALYVYKFGTGQEAIVFVGGTHGNEQSSVRTLNAFIDSLEAKFGSIPANKSIYVIPNINPDGYAANTRVNANSVDLNRNFPANNWKSAVSMPDGSFLENGGGSAALSEPESSSLASFVLSLSPRLVLTHHATGALAVANESGDSGNLAALYATKTGYRGLLNSQIGGVFHYDTTGAFEDWLHDKHGIAAILIEHTTAYGNEFWLHDDALWAMVIDS